MASTNRARVANNRLGTFPIAQAWFAAFALLVVATLWLTVLAAGDGVLRADVSITRFVQNHSSSFTTAISDFGNAFGTAKVGVPLGIAFALLLFWRGRPRGGALLLAATTMRIANYGLKAIFDSPRPTSDLVRVDSTRESNGFPSGHAQGATLLCGALLISFWPLLSPRQRVLGGVAASLVVLATGFARVSVGAHWPTDVLGGVLWGVILLSLAALTIKYSHRSSDASAQPE
jgi:membrane-associated phospholipid phosphatase